jgi:hypothetical protein
LLYAGFYRVNSNRTRKIILRSGLTLGVVGPSSGAEYTQNFIHRLLGNDKAAGWHNQIANGLIFDYSLLFRKAIRGLPDFLDLSASMNANLGSMMNFSSLGGRMIIGKFNDPYYNLGYYSRSSLNQAYIFFEGFGGVMFYNGTLSGSLIPFGKSVYTIPPEDISNWLAGGSYGLSLSFRGIMIKYQHFLIKQQYSSKNWHGWGDLSMVFIF